MASRSIRDLLSTGEPTFSFEFFPPKTEDGERTLWQALRELESLRPSFVSITYGAGGATRGTTVNNTERVGSEATLPPVGDPTAVDPPGAPPRRALRPDAPPRRDNGP